MSSLLNKLTGHKDNKDEHAAAHSTTSTSTAPMTSTAPYGASTADSTARTGAAYSNTANANVANANAANDNALFTQKQGISGGDAMTRSEEQLRVAKERAETGKAELNKYVTSEHVDQAVPVQRDRVVIEREPVNASNMRDAMDGPDISSAHFETTLREDRVQAAKETVPIERVRLAKESQSDVQHVNADLRKEHIDFTHTTLQGDKVDANNNANLNRTARKEAY